MTSGAASTPSSERLLQSARALEEAGQPHAAMHEAWRAYDMAGGEGAAKRSLVRLISRYPDAVAPDRAEEIGRLLADTEVDPLFIAAAGWRLRLAPRQVLDTHGDDPASLAARLEADPLVLGLLEQTYVFVAEAERALTGLRRWLLLSGRWPEFPRLVGALAAQASHNMGAWLYEPDEKTRFEATPETAIAAAYLPRRPWPASVPASAFADPVTAAVATQYQHWPYPAWTRAIALNPTTVPEAVAAVDGGRPSGLPVEADILIAGCGTGREAAMRALSFPDARVVAIDLSQRSLAYAEERCRALGIGGIEFRQLDLHKAADLGRRFHFIASSGVLHHLPQPEAGWAALAGVLHPGGVMRVMLYSKLARLRIRAAQAHIADLRERPVNDDLLREVRRRLMEKAPGLLADSIDFYTLPGIHDLLLHRHEDPFDVPRIGRALAGLGLELLGLEPPTPIARARYLEANPADPCFRDLRALAAMEKRQPFLFRDMYSLWARKPAA